MAEKSTRGRKPNPTPPGPRVTYEREAASYGWTKVLERLYQWDRETRNNKYISRKTIGYLPPGCTDNAQMVPKQVYLQARREEREREKREEQAGQKRGAPEERQAVGAVVDEPNAVNPLRVAADPEKPVYPSYLVLYVLMMCAEMDLRSSNDIAYAWEVWREDLVRLFKTLPEHDLSRDTARNFCIALDKCDPSLLFEQFTAMLLLEEGICERIIRYESPEVRAAFQRSVLALDRQAIRASTITIGTPGARSSFAIFDTSFAVEQARGQTGGTNGGTIGGTIGGATGDIHHAKRLLGKLDTRNAIITADAMHTRAELVQCIIEAGANYCMAVGDNQQGTQDNIRTAFDAPQNGHLVKTLAQNDKQDGKGHGRDGTLVINVLPGSVLDRETIEQWPGLENGSIARVVSAPLQEGNGNMSGQTSGNTRVETGCFISSLNHGHDWTVPSLLDVIRRHRCIENRSRWFLDVTYLQNHTQDHAQYRNDDCLRNVRVLDKVRHNFASAARAVLSKEYGEEVSMEMLRPHLTGLISMMALIAKVCVDEQTAGTGKARSAT